MTKRAHWDESEKRKQYQEKIRMKLEKILVDYEMEYADTPFYQNTSNCILEGAIDELKSIDVEKIDYSGEGCYFGGRIEALKKLKEDLNDALNRIEQLRTDGLETINELEKCKENNKKALKNLEIVFDVIDNKIKEFQDGEYGDLPFNTIHILLDLKDELSNEMSKK